MGSTSSSSLVELRVSNYQAIREGVITFDETGIVRNVGDNQAGKSAVIRALNALFFYANPRNHKRDISFGADSFRVEADFDDGVTIALEKRKDGKAFYEMFRHKKLVFTTLHKDLTDKGKGIKTEGLKGVPEEIAQYLNFIITPSGNSLNLGFSHEPQPFVTTKGDENYQLLNTGSGANTVTEALVLMKEDLNALTGENKSFYTEIRTLESLTEEYADLSEELADSLDDFLAQFSQGIEEHRSLSAMRLSYSSHLDALSTLLNPLTATDPTQLSSLLNLSHLSSAVSSVELSMVESVPAVDSSQLASLVQLARLVQGISDVSATSVDVIPAILAEELVSLARLSSAYATLEGISEVCDSVSAVDSSAFVSLSQLASVYESLLAVEQDIARLEGEHDSALRLSQEATHALHESGYQVHECVACGHFDVIGGVGSEG